MKPMSAIKRSCICALCIAFCYVLPLAFHALGLATTFSPIHIPVLLCGLLCGPVYGAFCGIAGPVLSSVLSGMPSATALISMVPELLVYGLVSGLLFRLIHTKNFYADIYLALIPAMVLGRVIGGAAKMLFYLSDGTAYTLSLWASAYFVQTLPGTILQLAVIPALVLVLTVAGLIPRRYPKQGVKKA